MKRINNLYDQFCSIDNILLADQIARKGKSKQQGIIEFDLDHDQNISDLYRELITKNYQTSKYKTRIIYERKPRVISILPYRDRVVQHAVMNILEPMFVSVFTADTYSCIKGKGIHAASRSLSKALRNEPETTYFLQIDIQKFYPSVDATILKQLLRKKIKDEEMLQLLDGIVDSAPGLPIGNYLSQYFANFYLAYFDHWIKEEMGVKHYFRYADDIIILSPCKKYLHELLLKIKTYLVEKLKLTVKRNHQVSLVKSHGINFVGYVHFHEYKLLRKTIKTAFARLIAKRRRSRNHEGFKQSVNAYLGWTKHANCKHLVKKLLHENI